MQRARSYLSRYDEATPRLRLGLDDSRRARAAEEPFDFARSARGAGACSLATRPCAWLSLFPLRLDDRRLAFRPLHTGAARRFIETVPAPGSLPQFFRATVSLSRCFHATSAVSSSAPAIVTRPISRAVTSASTRLSCSSARRKIVRGWPCEVDVPPPGAETARPVYDGGIPCNLRHIER